ncbi:SusC/RagA family TonB-linked outer membrane protein [Compostibacter hankyongensis]|uniref:TonB-dependent receptor n=1 Tax=Compostibacter hankyongensis TaxID=1007089 RepID=A0ABP8FVK4_9BACT
MKLTFVFLCFTFLQVSAKSYSQERLSFHFHKADLGKIFDYIGKKSDYSLLYKSALLPEGSRDIQVENMSVPDILQRLLSGTRLSYTILSHKLIVITPQDETARDTAIRGRVLSPKGDPLVGVSVRVKNSDIGAVTGADGSFTFEAPVDAELEVSYIGFETKTVPVAGGQWKEIRMTPAASGLNEVVVVGYGTQKKADLTGAVSSISGDNLSLRPLAQTSAGLEGMMPGVTVTQRNGKPGGDGGTIRIRGIGTMSNADPLVLIDGVEGSINNIDPNVIESVTVLKDAASAAIYGSRAANGVILVTTKRAKGKEFSVNYSGYFGWQQPTNLPDLAGAADFMELTNVAYKNAGRTPLYSDEMIAKYRAQGSGSSDSLPNTDWQKKVLTGSGFQQSHFVSVNAGTDKLRLLTSVGYLDQKGVVPNSEFKRLTLRSNANIILSKKLDMQVDLQYIKPQTTEPAMGVDGIFANMNSISPNKLAINSNGTWGEGWIGLNPVMAARAGGINRTNAPWGSINAGLNYRPSDWLSLNLTYAPKFVETHVNKFTKAIQTYFPDGSKAYINPAISSLNVSDKREFYNNMRGTATFDKNFGLHSLKVMGGVEQNSYRTDDFSAFRDGYVLPDYPVLNTGSANNLNNGGTASEWSLLSFFGRVNYNYKEKYLLELNARYDGSSRFSPGNKWGLFPSASAGWRISEENFMAPLRSTVDELKLRASWGRLGNQNIGDSYYPSVSAVELGSYSLGGEIVGVAALNDLANGNITWETTEMTDVGLDVSLFSHLSVTADYYFRKTRDILLQLNIPLIVGLGAPFQNAGRVNNQGWELGIAYNGKAGDFKYDIGVNLSDVRNKVIDMHGISQSDVTVNREGYAMNSIFGLQADGFFQDDQDVKDHAKQYGTVAPGDIKYKDQNGDGIINESDKVILGSTIPRYTYAANINLSWKQIDLSLSLQGVGKVDGLIYGGGLMPFYVTSAGGTIQEQYKDYWSPDNKDAAYPRLVFGASNNQQVSSFWMRSAAYLRLKNIQIGYTLPDQLTSRLKMKGIRLFVSGYNLFTLDKFWKGYDVETSVGTAGSYPIMRVFSFGINANF